MMIMGNLRKLSVIGLLALAGATSGCIIDSSHSCSGSAVQTDWAITDASGNPLTCAAAGASFVDFYVDGTMVDSTLCTDGAISTAVSPGTHTVQYKLVDSAGNVLSSVPALAATVASCGTTLLPSITFAVAACADGAVQAEWHLSSQGASVLCASGDTVTITVDGMNAQFPCSAYTGTTPSVTGGVSHNVSLTLRDVNGTVVSQTQSMSLPVRCGTTEDIGDVEFVTP